MLQFPAWKVILITLTLVIGTLMALPNAFSNRFLGVEPPRPSVESVETLAEWRREVIAAQESWWPGFLPSSKVNLGLDLRGGVYLLMEIRPEDVVANRLRVFSADVLEALAGRSVDNKVFHTSEVVDGELVISLTRNRMDENSMVLALSRLRAINDPIPGAIGGARTFDIQQQGDARIVVSLTDAAVEVYTKEAQSKTLQIVRRRVDPDGVRDINPVPQGDNRIILEVPGEPDPTRIKNVLSQAGELTFSLVNDTPSDVQQAIATGRAPVGWRLLTDVESGEQLLVNNTPVVTGADVATASQGFDPDDNTPAVNFRLNGQGQDRFSRITQENVNRRFAIVLDEQVMSAPVIRQPIYGGNVQISGGFGGPNGMQEAIDLAAIIEAGELPAQISFIEERTVGPGLGEDSIRAGTLASMIGLALVAVFMIVTYGRFGIMAVVSLFANIVLILGALSGLGATLTLPGIAGIILTIGMAVDANVLVFERIREEKANGRSPITSIQAGYEQALSTILDANITTFIAAAVLYMLGSGPVKGFAVTLAIGIVTSVFTAFVVTRWIMASWVKWARPKTLAI